MSSEDVQVKYFGYGYHAVTFAKVENDKEAQIIAGSLCALMIRDDDTDMDDVQTVCTMISRQWKRILEDSEEDE